MKMLHVTIQTKFFQEEMDFFLKHVGLNATLMELL
jgi:hypothetical protein